MPSFRPHESQRKGGKSRDRRRHVLQVEHRVVNVGGGRMVSTSETTFTSEARRLIEFWLTRTLDIFGVGS